ncbi:type II toxin-antitoxin system RelE/ParE family toxin [Romeria aff. gracilis LEGE 07310]|uniref:Type II toxin-antitoxin system RelE/ParE family toxin n=1 Tax=Vasconcelosia minhoensis LEGE 07310 TaxID=915328 RepID=A0A8J7DPR7_9CYAN|nr:type II toxin-antitoxin system RelE/ParE family toxin [Romeria gracilis]MBE9080165.1 type II toxin-antitoxin system RelE/ParE family toxin [Romeria aff. gracilis LEGE 07310]
MSNVCRFTPTASRDLENIIDYIAERADLDAAERILRKINEKCLRLASFPGMGRLREELAPNLRSFPIEQYLIFYRSVEDGVEIIRILSGYQNVTALFEEID